MTNKFEATTVVRIHTVSYCVIRLCGSRKAINCAIFKLHRYKDTTNHIVNTEGDLQVHIGFGIPLCLVMKIRACNFAAEAKN